MSKRYWIAGIALGYLAVVAGVTAYVSNTLRPQIVTYPQRPAALSCGYEQARTEADNARERRDNPPQPLSKTAAADAAQQAEAAERKQTEAQRCEERARETSDLDAQWANAAAAQNAAAAAQSVYRWAGWELAAVLLALGAAAWAAWEARQSTRATREIGENQTRAYVLATGVKASTRRDILGQLSPAIWVRNTGTTPAVELKAKGRLLEVVGYGEESKEIAFNIDGYLDCLAPNEHEPMIRGSMFSVPPRGEMRGDLILEIELAYTDVFGTRLTNVQHFVWESVGLIRFRPHPRAGTYFKKQQPEAGKKADLVSPQVWGAGRK